MAFSNPPGAVHELPNSQINTTPLVDVMLVLLIIFMITAPLVSHRVDAQIPQPGPEVDHSDPISVQISAAGGARLYFLDGEITDFEGLRIAFRHEGRKDPKLQATFKLQADDAVPYEQVAQLMATAHQSGVARFGFAEL